MIPNTFDSGGEQISWESYEPTAGAGNGAAIVLAYGSDGMIKPWDEMIRGHAKALTANGFVALIPNYFQKKQGAPHGDSQAIFRMILSRHDDWRRTLEDAVTEAGRISGINAARIGLLGYSLGGFLCLRARRCTPVLVEFFAPYQFPTVLEPPLLSGLGGGTRSQLQVQIHHGGDDKLVPFDDHATMIESDLTGEGASVYTTKYRGAGHGFIIGDKTANAKALSEASKATVAFFKSNL
jgi:dienelactone hydrolase